MNAAVLRTVPVRPVNAPVAEFSRGRNPHHVVRTDPLRIVCRVNDPDLRIECLDFINNGRGNLEIDIVQMHRIRMEILQDSLRILFLASQEYMILNG